VKELRRLSQGYSPPAAPAVPAKEEERRAAAADEAKPKPKLGKRAGVEAVTSSSADGDEWHDAARATRGGRPGRDRATVKRFEAGPAPAPREAHRWARAQQQDAGDSSSEAEEQCGVEEEAEEAAAAELEVKATLPEPEQRAPKRSLEEAPREALVQSAGPCPKHDHCVRQAKHKGPCKIRRP
jgi:hypothetical protein